MESNIAKIDDDQRLVFGWASVSVTKDGEQVEDSQGDIIDPADLETAAYEFVLKFREANAMHVGPVVGHLVESFVATPEKLEKMGLAADALPTGWWAGWKIADDEVWQGIKSGHYQMFSIEGHGQRVPA